MAQAALRQTMCNLGTRRIKFEILEEIIHFVQLPCNSKVQMSHSSKVEMFLDIVE